MTQPPLFLDPLEWVKAHSATLRYDRGRWSVAVLVQTDWHTSRFVEGRGRTPEDAIAACEARIAELENTGGSSNGAGGVAFNAGQPERGAQGTP